MTRQSVTFHLSTVQCVDGSSGRTVVRHLTSTFDQCSRRELIVATCFSSLVVWTSLELKVTAPPSHRDVLVTRIKVCLDTTVRGTSTPYELSTVLNVCVTLSTQVVCSTYHRSHRSFFSLGSKYTYCEASIHGVHIAS